MEQFPRLSNREWDVLKLLLQGKSNKLIASSLGISVRTVEFHLKNIYAKFQVSSRIELILKLGNTTGSLEAEKLGRSTVDSRGKIAENRDKLTSRTSWATSFRTTVSIIGKELEMKNLKLTHVFMGVITALLAGLLWGAVWKYSRNLTIPLIIILVISELIVGAIGKRRGEAPLKVLFSVVLGTGLSPLVAIPFMAFAVIPIGRIVVNLGFIDPSTIPTETATTIAMGIMMALWLIASIALGIVLLKLFITIRLRTSSHDQFERTA
jgi:DNA-binding CsgD family transcriptional regulator